MGAFSSKPPTKFDMISEAFRLGKPSVAAELMYRYVMEEKVLALLPTLPMKLSDGDRGFTIEFLKNTKATRVLFQHLVDKHAGTFDEQIFSHVKSALSEHDLQLIMVIDDDGMSLHGTLWTKI